MLMWFWMPYIVASNMPWLMANASRDQAEVIKLADRRKSRRK